MRVHHVEEAKRRHRRDASRGRELGPTLGVAPATLAERRDDDGGGLGAQHARTERQRRRSRAHARAPPRRRAKPPSGPTSATTAPARDGQLVEPARGLVLPRRPGAAPGHGCATTRGERYRRVDRGNAGASGLLRRRHRDAPPALDVRARAPTTCAVADRARCAARRARSPSRRSGPSSCPSAAQAPGPGRAATRASGRVLATMRPIASRAPTRSRTTSCSPPASSSTRSRAPGREAQRAEVTELGARDVYPGLASVHAGQVEAQHQRSRRSVRHGPAARVAVTRSSGNAARRPQPARRAPPRRRAGRRARRPRRASSRASATSVSASRFATTRSNRARSAATPPPSSEDVAGAPLRVEVRARERAARATSMSSATTRGTPSRASARGEHAGARADVERRAHRRRRRPPPRSPRGSVRVVSCWPVPNAMPGSITSTSRPAASGTSHGGATSKRVPIATGRWWVRIDRLPVERR